MDTRSTDYIEADGLSPESFALWADEHSFIYRAAAKRIAQVLSLPSGVRVADIGMGPGNLAFAMKEVFGTETQVFGVDVDQRFVEMASNRFCVSGLSFVCDDACALSSIETASLDAVVVFHTLHHISVPSDMFNAAFRVLKPGGELLVVDWNPHSWFSCLARSARVWPVCLRRLAGWGRADVFYGMLNSIKAACSLRELNELFVNGGFNSIAVYGKYSKEFWGYAKKPLS